MRDECEKKDGERNEENNRQGLERVACNFQDEERKGRDYNKRSL